MFLHKNALLFVFFLLSPFERVMAQGIQQSPIINIPHIQGKIKIDGNLSEKQWLSAKKILINNITRPYNNIPSPVNTEALLMEDGKNFYIAFIADDPDPKKIRAYLKDRDKSWGDDLVGIKIDTYNDHRQAYRFLVNPLGVQMDAIENELTKSDSNAWDGIWSSYGKITKKGYIVEMALPLRMLNFRTNVDIQKWGIELLRFYPRKQFLRLSNIYLDRNNSCEICQLATIKGFAGAKQGNNLTITPAIVTGASEQYSKNNQQWQKTHKSELSADIRWGITPDILLNATINPDFSTVETDSAQLNINNNFALFFKEKRPFFLDNADYFKSDYNLIYTRNINAPNYGVKLTGRQDKQSFALFVTDDKNTNFLIPGNRSSNIATINGNSKAAALRYQLNYNKALTLGWISTLRMAKNYNNQVHGIDAQFRATRSDVIKFQGLYSKTKYPKDLFKQFCSSDNTQDCARVLDHKKCDLFNCNFNESVLRTLKKEAFSGNALKITYTHNGEQWFYQASYNKQNAGFRGDLGFISKVDQKDLNVELDHRWYGLTNQWWNRFQLSSHFAMSHNDNNELINKYFSANIELNALYDSYFQLGIIKQKKVGRRLDKSVLNISGNTHLFAVNRIHLYAQMKPLSNVSLSTFISYGDEIDFVNDRLGNSIKIVPAFKWNINVHWELKIKHTFNQLNANNVAITNSNVFNARLTDIRTTYQFDVRSFLRLTFIYDNTNKNVANYLYQNPNTIKAKTRILSSELLYAYKINSQTVLYLGYTTHAQTVKNRLALQQDQRNIFMKFSYAWLG